MDPQRLRIQDDLRGLLSGDVRCDPCFLQLYASDASVYQIHPLGVVRPRSVADVVATVQYAAEKQIPLHPRGAGTSVAGQSLGPGLIVDFSRYLRRLVRMEPDRVRVQPGLVHQQLNTLLQPKGRFFGPDPGNSRVSTIGGMISLDASGSHRLRYGSTRGQIVSVQVVLADGQVMELGTETVSQTPGPSRKEQLVADVASLLSAQAAVIAAHRPPHGMAQSGYQLGDILCDHRVQMARLLAGAEGTLGLITEVTLATQPLPRHRGVTLLAFDSLEKAARAAVEILKFQPTACELMDRRHLVLVRESELRLDLLVPRDAEAVLLVEQEGENPREVRQRVEQLVEQMRQPGRWAGAARQAFEPEEMQLFWQLAERFQPAFSRLRPLPVVDDMAVPVESLAPFLTQLQNVLKRHEVTASVFAHAGHGQVHVRPFLELDGPAAVEKIRRLADDLYQEVRRHGGIPGGENGLGLARSSYVREQYGPLCDVMRQVKSLFDPQGLLNPDKIFCDDTEQPVRHLRPSRSDASIEMAQPPHESGMRDLVELQLNWDPQPIAEAANRCNGCGECRKIAAGGRMCPIFRFQPSEEASPRAKANLLRGVLQGQLGLTTLTNDHFKAIADLCVHCHMCRLECPAAVDIPRMIREGKGAFVAANGLPAAEWLMTRLDLVASLASQVPWLANWALGNRQMRWLLEKLLGIARGRKLPRVARHTFLRHSAMRRLVRPTRRSGQKVLYFVDVYANHFDLQLGEALVAVLEHNGVEVYVHPGQRPAGMPAVALGALDLARRLAHHNVGLLADAVRQGYHIVATEPAAALCLAREYPQLLEDEDSRLVAAHASEASTYLWNLHKLGRLQLDFRPLHTALAYHRPCHLKALPGGIAGKNLLQLIPGLHVEEIEEGCSGMAGTFGLLRKNYRNSLRAGWSLIARLRDPQILAGTTECSACKMQMEQGSSKPTIHPVKLLALAYGLMPELASLLTRPGRELIVT